MKRVLYSAILFTNLLLPVSCITEDLQNVRNLKNIQVDFRTIRVKNLESQGLLSLNPRLAMDTEMEVWNPNTSGVTIYAFDFDVSLLDEEKNEKDLLGKILSEEEIRIPPESKVVVPLKIRSEFEERITTKLAKIGIRILNDLYNNKETVFELSGTIKYKTIFGNISIPVRELQKAKLR